MLDSKNWFKLALFYFVLVAGLGLVLRTFPFIDSFPFEFRNLIHAHSHVAMLGWVFNVLLLGITTEYIGTVWNKKPLAVWLFWGIQLSVVGMLISFAVQGYAVWSIACSTLHILLSYTYIVRIVKELQLWNPRSYGNRLLLWALIFLFLSSLGPWGLAIISAKGLAGTPIYKAAIYWFLHFTYNGWMTLALLAIWSKIFNGSSKSKVFGLWLVLVSVPITFILSLYEFELPLIWHVLGIISGIMQLVGFGLLCADWLQKRKLFQNRFLDGMFKFSLVMLLLKCVLQIVSAFPAANSLAFFNRDIIILYMHLVFIGWISVGCLAYGLQNLGASMDQRICGGLLLFGFGFVVQELVLTTRVLDVELLPIRFQNSALWIASLLMTAGLSFVLLLLKSESIAMGSNARHE